MQSLKRILKSYQIDEDKQRRISREWQDYAYRLALELEDLEHKAIYMRLAKNEDRSLLEEVRIFVRGANAKIREVCLCEIETAEGGEEGWWS